MILFFTNMEILVWNLPKQSHRFWVCIVEWEDSHAPFKRREENKIAIGRNLLFSSWKSDVTTQHRIPQNVTRALLLLPLPCLLNSSLSVGGRSCVMKHQSVFSSRCHACDTHTSALELGGAGKGGEIHFVNGTKHCGLTLRHLTHSRIVEVDVVWWTEWESVREGGTRWHGAREAEQFTHEPLGQNIWNGKYCDIDHSPYSRSSHIWALQNCWQWSFYLFI